MSHEYQAQTHQQKHPWHTVVSTTKMRILPNCEIPCPCTCTLPSSTLAKWTSTSRSSCPNTWHRSVLLWDHSWRWWRNMRFVALLRHGLWRLATLLRFWIPAIVWSQPAVYHQSSKNGHPCDRINTSVLDQPGPKPWFILVLGRMCTQWTLSRNQQLPLEAARPGWMQLSELRIVAMLRAGHTNVLPCDCCLRRFCHSIRMQWIRLHHRKRCELMRLQWSHVTFLGKGSVSKYRGGQRDLTSLKCAHTWIKTWLLITVTPIVTNWEISQIQWSEIERWKTITIRRLSEFNWICLESWNISKVVFSMCF